MSEIRMLDELGAELARVAAERRRVRPRRRVLAAVLTGALVLGAVPATRAGIEDITTWSAARRAATCARARTRRSGCSTARAACSRRRRASAST